MILMDQWHCHMHCKVEGLTWIEYGVTLKQNHSVKYSTRYEASNIADICANTVEFQIHLRF